MHHAHHASASVVLSSVYGCISQQNCTAVVCFNIFKVIVDSIQVLAVSTRASRVNSLLGRPHRHVVSRLFVLALSSIELVPSSCPARANPIRLPGTESWCRTASIPRIHAVPRGPSGIGRKSLRIWPVVWILRSLEAWPLEPRPTSPLPACCFLHLPHASCGRTAQQHRI